MSGVEYGQRILRDVAARCEVDPEREACGFVVRRGSELDVVQLPNVADRYHQADGAAFPRTSRDSYVMEARALRRLHDDLDRVGGQIVAVWHSHVEAGACFSARDRADAVAGGQQLVPGAEYLVFSIRSGRVAGARCFRYAGGEFVEADLGRW